VTQTIALLATTRPAQAKDRDRGVAERRGGMVVRQRPWLFGSARTIAATDPEGRLREEGDEEGCIVVAPR